MGSLEGSLPAYMNPGRGSMTGPRTGVYFTWVVSGKDLINGEASTYRWLAPMDCRIMSIILIADDVTSDPTYRVKRGFSPSGGDEITGTHNWPASDTAEILEGDDLSYRDISKNQQILVSIIADAGDALLGYTIIVTMYAKGHLHNDPIYD